MVVKAIFEDGVFKPTEKVSLPEHTQVEFVPTITSAETNTSPEGMEEIYEILNMRFDDPNSPGDLAQCHNEHQP